MARKPTLSDTELVKVYKLYKSGEMSVASLMRKYDKSKAAIYQWLHKGSSIMMEQQRTSGMTREQFAREQKLDTKVELARALDENKRLRELLMDYMIERQKP